MLSPPLRPPVWVAAHADSALSVVCGFSDFFALAAFGITFDRGVVAEGYRRKSSLHTGSPRRRMLKTKWAPHGPSQVANNRHNAGK